MRCALALLIAGLAMAPPALAQLGDAPKPEVEAEAHIVSAFTSRADPRVLSERVALGPALREQLGADADRRRIYDSLVALLAGKPLRTRSLPAAEAASHASSLPGLNVAQPLVMLEAGDVRLLLQYAPGERNVAFVEQLAGPTVAAPTPPQAPKPEPIVEVPLPTEPPPVAAPPARVPAPPAPVATPSAPVAVPPAPVAAPPAPVAPRATPPVAVQKPAAPAPRTEKPRPRGECVIKPVMSEQDLWNCSAPGQASLPQIAVPAPVIPAPAPATAGLQTAPQRECVIKPVMSEEDLRICAVASKARPTATMETTAPQPVAAPPANTVPPQPRECVIKPVMSEEDLRACGTRR